MKKALSIILLILFILVFPVTLFYFNLNRTLLNPIFLKDTLSNVNVYSRLAAIDPRIITDYLSDKEGRAANPDSAAQTDQFIGQLTAMISPDVVKSTVERNVDEVFNTVIEKQKETMNVDVSLVKQSLVAKNTHPEYSEFINQIKESYQIPVPPQLKSTQNQLAKRKIMAPLYLGISLLLIVIAALLWPGWKGKLRLLGIVFLVDGIIITVGSLILKLIPMPNFAIISIQELGSIVKDILAAMKLNFLNIYLYEGIILVALGLVLTIVSAFVKGASSPVTATPAVPPAQPNQKPLK